MKSTGASADATRQPLNLSADCPTRKRWVLYTHSRTTAWIRLDGPGSSVRFTHGTIHIPTKTKEMEESPTFHMAKPGNLRNTNRRLNHMLMAANPSPVRAPEMSSQKPPKDGQ